MDLKQLTENGLSSSAIEVLEKIWRDHEKSTAERWMSVVDCLRDNPKREPVQPSVFRALFESIWDLAPGDWTKADRPPMWFPDERTVRNANVSSWMFDVGVADYRDFHRWTVEHRESFWEMTANRLAIRWEKLAARTVDLSAGVARARWFPGAELNIANSCFHEDENRPAVVWQRPGEALQRQTYGELREQSQRISGAIAAAGFRPGDRIAVVLPMTALSVSIYLGIVMSGCAVISIADSFAAPEIANRLRIAKARAVITYDQMVRSGKLIPLYSRVKQATDLPIVVIPDDGFKGAEPLRNQDVAWDQFLDDAEPQDAIVAAASEPINILFSSGTTGEPKAIPWTHLTPIRCAADGLLHQDIHPGDVVVWPTNLGWMMGPWLIFASLINQATIGLYEDVPMGEGFGRFIQETKTRMLGVVPTIVKSWRSTRCMESFDWSSIHVFSSTGESSHPEDYFYLSSLAGMRPVIEYCGGTEIGGGYITSTVVQPNIASAFSTAAVGLDVVILDEEHKPTDDGQLYLVAPSVGLSETLLNRDHFETYYEGTPLSPKGQTLRRHGDHFRRLESGYFVAGGRVDDTMNLGGIKVSSAEIERVLNQIDGVRETAAIAITEGGGPEQLVIFAVLEKDYDADTLMEQMNRALKGDLNPLFKVAQVQVIDQLPRTASNKVMRRELRAQLQPA